MAPANGGQLPWGDLDGGYGMVKQLRVFRAEMMVAFNWWSALEI